MTPEAPVSVTAGPISVSTTSVAKNDRRDVHESNACLRSDAARLSASGEHRTTMNQAHTMQRLFILGRRRTGSLEAAGEES